MAQKAQRIGAADGLFVFAKHAERFLQRGQQLCRLLAVHGVAQLVVRGHARASHDVKQRVRALISQQKRIRLVT